VRSTSASKAAITAVRASADSKVLMTISRCWLDNGSIIASTSATLPEATTIAQWSRYYVSGYEKSTTTHSQTQLNRVQFETGGLGPWLGAGRTPMAAFPEGGSVKTGVTR
jgi:hypothetical protein